MPKLGSPRKTLTPSAEPWPTQGFAVTGAHACDSCHLLKQVDLSNTKVEEIQEFTFAHCTGLREISFPQTLHTIRVKAFMNCAALLELAIPPSLKHIGSRAFLDCTTLRRVVKRTEETLLDEGEPASGPWWCFVFFVW